MSATDYSQDRSWRAGQPTTPLRRDGSRRMRRTTWPVRVVVGAVLIATFLICGTAFRVWYVARADDRRPVDAVVVLGAAQYDGDPSPVFKARLDHAAYLYEEGFSDRVIVTGGKAVGDRFSEAEAGNNYLVEVHGVDADAVLQEAEGLTTLESMNAVQEIADENDIDTLLLVSDPMHSERIKRIAHDLGFEDAHTSPASYLELQRSRFTKAKELIREIGSLMVYEVWDR